jgi:lysine-specific demethylase 8
VTGYHIDWADNLLAQIVGRKFVKLVSFDQRKQMYPSSKYDSNTLMSSVNADNYDRNRYPEFANVDALYTVLEPGEILFIPRGYWHYVRSLDPSISVNNFGIDWKSFFRDKPREYAKKYLHRLGLYGKECTCHTWVNGKRIRRES